MEIKQNVGGMDRIARIVAGVALLAGAAFLDTPLRWWGLIGFVPLLTGIFRFCPAYLPFGASSCTAQKSSA